MGHEQAMIRGIGRGGISSGARVVAVAAVIEHPNGARTIIGSRDIHAMSLSMEVDAVGLHSDTYRSYLPLSATYEFSATMGSVQVHHAEPVDAPLAVAQRGIYLPDMSFRALPAPRGDA